MHGLRLAVACSLAALAVGCGDDGGPRTGAQAQAECESGPAVQGRPLRIVTTVAPLTSIVANIAGPVAQVTGLVPEGVNSHTFEPAPSAAEALSRADVVFVNGLGLEDPTVDLARANLSKGGRICEMGTTTVGPDFLIFDFSFPKSGGKPNPHVWTDPPYARAYAFLVMDVLSRRDPANRDSYRANFDAFVAKEEALDEAMKTATATLDPSQRQLLTYHDAYAYFAQHYGWEVIGAIQPSSFAEPTAKEVAALIDQVRATGVKAIFGSEVFPSPVLEEIGKEAGVRYVDSLRDDDLPGGPGDPEHSWLGLMRFDFVTMIEALGGDASALKALDTTDVTQDTASYPQ